MRTLKGKPKLKSAASRKQRSGQPYSRKFASAPRKQRSADSIQSWLISGIAKRLKVKPKTIDIEAPFASFGMDSLEATSMTYELEVWLGRKIEPTLFWDYPSIHALSEHLGGPSQNDRAPGARQ